MAMEGPVVRAGTHIFTWGRGDLGQLGISQETSKTEPVLVRAVESKDIAHVAASVFNSAFITADAELWTTGSNDSGQLGHKGHDTQLQPSRVQALDAHGVCQIACGQQHMLAVAGQGALCAWGAADLGQLGLGQTGVEQPQPRFIKGTKEQHFVRVAAGESHSLALTSSGSVWSFGQSNYGALGQGNASSSHVPCPIPSLATIGIVQIACGESHSAAMAIDGRVFTWGRGKYGALGLGSLDNSYWPQHVHKLHLKAHQVVCGGEHTMVIAEGGGVYSWGRSSHGQTGHGHLETLFAPRLIQALQDHYITQLTAGLRHSMALTDTHQVWVWGDNSEGQLGVSTQDPCTSPAQMLSLPGEGTVRYIVAGGEHSVAALHHHVNGEVMQHMWADCRGSGLAALPLPSLEQGLNQADAKTKVTMLKRSAQDLFSCPGFMLHTFSDRSPDPVDTLTEAPSTSGAAQQMLGLDMARIKQAYNALLQVYSVELLGVMGQACKRQLDIIHKALAATEQQRSPAAQQLPSQGPCLIQPLPLLRALFILLQNPMNGDRSGLGSQLMEQLANICTHLPQWQLQCLLYWLQTLSLDLFASRCVRPLQRYLDQLSSSQGTLQDREHLMRAVHLLYVMYGSNEDRHPRLPYAEFYNKDVSRKASLSREYVIWRNMLVNPQALGQGGKQLVSLCQMPFILDPEAKARIMQGEALLYKQHEVHASAINALFQGIHPASVQYLDVRIRRTHVLQDALNQLMQRPGELKKPLRVTFISGGLEEEGLDEGGVTKEFFQLLIRQIFNENFGMFRYQEATRTFWFSHLSIELESEYELVGSVLGLAIYNGVILDVHFPPVLYKKLLQGQPDFQDLAKAMPDLGHGLQQLLDYSGNVEADIPTTFSVEEENFGELVTHDLKSGGSHMPVTNSNRQEYVDLYTQWLLEGSISKQFGAFSKGFHQVCGGLALSLFRYEELELLVCGLPHLNFAELRAGARYDGGYHAEHETIKQFWEVVMAFAFEQKKSFLRFCTGTDRAPVGGLSDLKLIIQKAGPDSDRLPTSHTCFNALLLPEYASKEKLHHRLSIAIENAQGFGLQ